MTASARFATVFVALTGLVAAGFFLMNRGLYGLSLFTLFPILLGGLAAWALQPATAARAAWQGAAAVMLATMFLFLLGKEGAICIVMSWPLVLPLGAAGGVAAHYARSSHLAGRGGAALLLLLPPAGLTWDVSAQPPVFQVRTAIEIAAPPETVWKHVVAFSELPPPQEWFFRAGIAYPMRARIEGAGPGAVRYCDFSTGPFVEPIEVWDEPRLLRFRVTENPAPLHEWSPYARVLPKHLHGYLISRQGQFLLTPLPHNRTLLEGTTWYQHGLWPAEYWRLWSDAIIHRIHLRVLHHIRTLAEADSW